MAYTELINQIKAAIKNNGVQLITGNLLQTQLLDMIEVLDLDITEIKQAMIEINAAIGEVSADYLPVTLKGANNGLAELDSTGIVKSSQLPTHPEEVLEYDNLASFPAIGEASKIYMAIDTNKTYRWGGTAYASLNAGVVLGVTSDTAFRGDQGKIAYDHSQITAGTGVHISDTERTNWNAAYSATHTHSNKSTLDLITDLKVSAWDAMVDNNHTHSNKAVLDAITSTKVSNWDTAHGWGSHASAGYALASSLANYLLLTGGTLEGASESLLTLNNTTPSASASYINYKASGVSKALIGYIGAHGAAIQNVQTGALLGIVGATGQPYYAANGTADKYGLYHQGNANNASTDWTARELISERLRIPSAVPTGMTAGKWYMTMADTGWSAELPGGGTGGVTSLWLLDETSLVGSPSNNQALIYNQTTAKWSNATLMIAHIDGLQAALNAKEGAITAGTASQYIRGDKTLGNMPTSLPASDVYAWAKAATKPSYSFTEITDKPATYAPSAHTHDDRYYTETEIGNYFSGSVGITGYNKSNWDTAYSYSQIGHLPLSGGTLTGDLSIGEILGVTSMLNIGIVAENYIYLNGSVNSTYPSRVQLGIAGWSGYFSAWNAGEAKTIHLSAGGNSWLNGGNFGIGYTDRTEKFAVNGNVYADGHATFTGIVYAGSYMSSTDHYVRGVGSSIYFDTTGAVSSNYIRTVNDYDLRLYVGRGTSCRLDLNNNGYVDIGGALKVSSYIESASYFKMGSNFIKTNSGFLELQSSTNEICIGGYTEMYVNYRAASGGTPTTWYWMKTNAGGYADFYIGALNTSGRIYSASYIESASSITAPTITAGTELITARLRIPKLTGAPTGLTNGEWYQFMV